MAYDNFKATIWSKYIQHELPKFTVFTNDCDYAYEGEAKKGGRVKILGVGRPTIKDYVQGTDIDSPETLADTSVFLDIDQQKYFSFGIDDVDKAQASGNLKGAYMEEAIRAIAEKKDAFVAEQLGKNGGYVSASTSITTEEACKNAIDTAFVELWNNGVSSKDKLTIYLTPWMYNLFKNNLTSIKSKNDSLIATGLVGSYNNATVKMSNNIFNDGTDDHIIVKTSKGYAFAETISELKAFAPEKSFSEAIKGLHCYGGKAVRPKEIAVIKCHNS